MRVFLNGTVIEVASEAGQKIGSFQKGSLNLTPINDNLGVLIGLKVNFQATNLVNTGVYDSGNAENRISNGAGVAYATAQLAWDALSGFLGFSLGGGGGSVTSVTASSPLSSSGGATPNISFSAQPDGNYGLNFASGVVTFSELPIFLYETSTIADFVAGQTHYYIGGTAITYDYDLLPYPLPLPVSGFNFVNLSTFDVTIISDG